jgi:hypothetical protein
MIDYRSFHGIYYYTCNMLDCGTQYQEKVHLYFNTSKLLYRDQQIIQKFLLIEVINLRYVCSKLPMKV